MKKVSPQLARYYANKEEINARRRAYRAAHRVEVNLKAKVYRATRKEEIRRYNNEYAKKIPYLRLKKVSTPDLIAELERRRPKCSVETCGHIGSELCGTCIWGVFIGEEDGSIKDNFKEAK